MRFHATEEQVRHLLALATNASVPAGLGFLQATTKEFTAADFPVGTESVDYVQGRMVKLVVYGNLEEGRRIREPQYVAGDMERTYQSWGGKYPTASALIEAAGLEPLP